MADIARTPTALVAAPRAMRHRPPAIKLPDTIEIDTYNHHRLSVVRPGHDQTKRSCQTTTAEHRFNLRKSAGGKGSALSSHDDNIGPIVAELAMQLRLHASVQIKHCRGNRGGHNHGQEG